MDLHALTVEHRNAGRYIEAISLAKQVLVNRERTLGPDHPDTIQARVELSLSH